MSKSAYFEKHLPPIRPMHPGRWAPIGERAKVFAAQKECSACRKSGQCLCMQEVKPVEMAKYLLERSNVTSVF
ncbi:MAG: hypothetical protein LBK47_08400 [Prevotellaceae bacterium]|nr:hypothetical protein [Prevotellaceae bacterium]